MGQRQLPSLPLENGPVSTAQAQKSDDLAGRPLTEVTQAVAMLVAGGYAVPRLPQGASTTARRSAKALNLALIEANARGPGGAAVPAVSSRASLSGRSCKAVHPTSRRSPITSWHNWHAAAG